MLTVLKKDVVGGIYLSKHLYLYGLPSQPSTNRLFEFQAVKENDIKFDGQRKLC